MKNNKGRVGGGGAGVINFLPLKRGGGCLLEGGRLNRGFTVVTFP